MKNVRNVKLKICIGVTVVVLILLIIAAIGRQPSYYFFFFETIFGGFTVFYCDTTLDVLLCTEAAPFFLIANAQRRDPQGALAGN